MDVAKYRLHVEEKGDGFGFDLTCGAMRCRVYAGGEVVENEGRPTAIVGLRGETEVAGCRLGREYFLFLPHGYASRVEVGGKGLVLVVEFTPVCDEPEILNGPLCIPPGRACGYVRTQYRGLQHGRGDAFARFNPDGIRYTDKLWGCSKDVLSQELCMPAGSVIPVHVHGVPAEEPDADGMWQMYYVWEGTAVVEMASPGRPVGTVEIGPGDVLVYPPGTAHNVKSEGGCRYLYFERKAKGSSPNLDLDEEFDYERKLTCRLGMGVEAFLESGMW